MARKSPGTVEEMVETATNLLFLGIGTAAMHGARFVERVRNLVDELDPGGIRFQFTVKCGQVYWRRQAEDVWIGVNKPALRHTDQSLKYVTLRVDMTRGVPHFDTQVLEKVAVLIEDPVYESYREDQATLELFGEPEVLELVAARPTKYRLTKIKKALAAARDRRAQEQRKRKMMQRQVRDLFGLNNDSDLG